VLFRILDDCHDAVSLAYATGWRVSQSMTACACVSGGNTG
jgi:hypothetical protein